MVELMARRSTTRRIEQEGRILAPKRKHVKKAAQILVAGLVAKALHIAGCN
jgi:hypothetical protein